MKAFKKNPPKNETQTRPVFSIYNALFLPFIIWNGQTDMDNT